MYQAANGFIPAGGLAACAAAGPCHLPGMGDTEDRERPPCDTCGREAAVVIDGRAWCASCMHARGSCCAESEMEDDIPQAGGNTTGGS